LNAEVENTRRKAAAGAQFLQTQAIYDREAFDRFVAAAGLENTALLAGIIPLKSARMAQWLNDNIPGICVPDALTQEMAAVAGDADRELRTSIDISARIIAGIKDRCAGVHLMMMGWERHIPAYLEAAGLR
jgi:5,10-methylenetetrahydrofolate reductase